MSPRKLPELGRLLGKGIAEFKRATNELQSSLEQKSSLKNSASLAMMPRPPRRHLPHLSRTVWIK